MEKPLQTKDAVAMVRLVADVTGRRLGPTASKQRLMRGLCALVQADCWAWTLCYIKPGAPPTHVSLLHEGFTDESFAQIVRASQHPDLGRLMAPFARELEAAGQHLTRTRQEIDRDNHFPQSAIYPYYLAAGVRPLMLSVRPINERCCSHIAIYRRADREEFTERERQIAHIVLSEVAWLHGLGWPEDLGVRVPSLAPRSRAVLNLLLEGHSRQFIAEQLGLSIHTASGYVKQVYAALGVQSHAELMRRFSARETAPATAR